MACLFACFSFSKHKRRRLFIKGTSSTRRGDHKALLQAKELGNQDLAEKPSNTIAIIEAKHEDQRGKCSTKNKNLFQDLPVKAVSEDLIKQSGLREDEKSGEEQQRPRVVLESSEQKGNWLAPESNDTSQSCSRTGSRLKDLAFEGFEKGDSTDGEKGGNFVMEESSESLFSLSIDSRKRVSEVDFGGEKEVTSPMVKKENVSRMVESKLVKDGNQNAQDQVMELVPNPIENLTHRNTVQVNKEKLQEDHEKENITMELGTRGEEPMPNLSSKRKLADKEIAVDASLSSWLVESGANSVDNLDSKSRNSQNSMKGRPVLGELNMQEPKPEFVRLSKSSTRDQNFDDMPLIGTIGSYLSCTSQTRNRMITM